MCRGKSPKYYFDKMSQTCQLFFYGGCGGNENRFDSLDKCNHQCPVDLAAQKALRDVCALPIALGNCRADKKRFFFDADTRRCERFRYSGCQGNGNNFESRDDCLLACGLTLLLPSSNGTIKVGNAVTLPAELVGENKKGKGQGGSTDATPIIKVSCGEKKSTQLEHILS